MTNLPAAHRRTLLALLAATAILSACGGGGGGGGDKTAPAAITDLATSAPASTSIELSWTAPADDGSAGTASTTYDVRFSVSPIVDDASFAAATAAMGIPSPGTPGANETMTCTGLTSGTTYYFAVKTGDEVPNTSPLSNVPTGTTTPADPTPPADILDLAAGSPTSTTITLTWTAPGDDGLAGTAASYDVRYSTSPILTDTDFASAIVVGSTPSPNPAGTPESFTVTGLSPLTTYSFAVKTRDEVTNTSSLSNVPASATTTAPLDVTAPEAVSDLVVLSPTEASLNVSWTAPHEDGAAGGAVTSYDLRYSTAGPITTGADFAAATAVTGEPTPSAPGASESLVVTGLTPNTTYFFALESIDDAGNVSALSTTSPGGMTLAFPVTGTTAEVESNDTAGTATALAVGTAGTGRLDTATDVDFWSFPAAAGDVIQVQVFGTRMTQSTWDSSNAIPRLAIVGTDGTTELLHHDRASWLAGDHDLDIPMFEIPSTGTFYLELQASSGAAVRGYAVLVTVANEALTMEAEAAGTSGSNDSEATAEAISTPAIVHGWHVDGELDYYSIPATAGQVLGFDIKTYRNGIGGTDTYYNPRLRLYRPSGQQVKNVANTIFRDVEFTYRVNETGAYLVRVQDDGGTTGDGWYFLGIDATTPSTVVETEPNDTAATADPISYGAFVDAIATRGNTDWYSFTGTAGDMVRVKIYDSVINQEAADTVAVSLVHADGVTVLPSAGPGVTLNIVRTILQSSGTFFVKVTDTGTTTKYAIELTRFKAAAYESEANDTIATADMLDAGRRASGVVGTSTDVDVFGMPVVAGELVTLSIHARPAQVGPGSNGDTERSGHGSTLAPALVVVDSADVALASSTATVASVSAESVTDPLPTLGVTFVAPSTGTCYVKVSDATGSGSGATAYYVIERR